MYELYKVLKKSFPVFDLDNPVPLKRGITRDLWKFTGLEKEQAHCFLTWYRNKENYLRSIKTGSNIYNLHGLIVKMAFLEDELRARTRIKLIRKQDSKIKKKGN